MESKKLTKDLSLAIVLGSLIFGFAFFDFEKTNLKKDNQLAQVGQEDAEEFGCVYDVNSIIQNGGFENITNQNDEDGVYFLADGMYGEYFYPQEICFWFASPQIYVEDGMGVNQSKGIKISYVRHVLDGDPSNPMFNSHQTVGITQNIESISAGDYNLSFKLKPQSAPLGLLIALNNEPIPLMHFDGCGYNDNSLIQNTNQFFDYDSLECFSELFDKIVYLSDDNEFGDTTAFSDFSVDFQITSEEDLNYVYIYPIGYDPEFLAEPWSKEKPSGNLIIDNIAIEPLNQVNFCSIENTGSINPVIITDDGVAQEVLAGGLIEVGSTVFDNPELDTDLYNDGIYVHRMGEILDFDSLSSEWLSSDEILSGFNFLNMNIESILDFSGGHVLIEYACLTLCESDFDGNGIVNVEDMLALMNDIGCLGDDCVGDLNSDGITNVLDIVEFMPNLGEECLSQDVNDEYPEMSGFSPEYEPSKIDISYEIKKPNIFSKYNFVIKIKNNGESDIEGLKVQNILPSGFVTNIKYSNNVYDFNSAQNYISLVKLKGNELKTFGLNATLDKEVCSVIKKSESYSKIRWYNLCK